MMMMHQGTVMNTDVIFGTNHNQVRTKSCNRNRTLSPSHSYTDNSYASPARKTSSKQRSKSHFSPSRDSITSPNDHRHHEGRSHISRNHHHPYHKRRSSSNHLQELFLASTCPRSKTYPEENYDQRYGK